MRNDDKDTVVLEGYIYQAEQAGFWSLKAGYRYVTSGDRLRGCDDRWVKCLVSLKA